MSRHAPLRDYSLEELTEIVKGLGFPGFRACQLADWLYAKSALRFEEMKNLPKELIEKLREKYAVSSIELVETQKSPDGSKKFLFRTQDREFLESVSIYQGGKRHALCVSTQVGCKMRCRFCASGQGGWRRNLSAGEILDQAAFVIHETGIPIENVIYMGMGEPLDNFEAVVKSLQIFRADWGFRMGWRRLTVSTCGLIAGIERFLKEVKGEAKLAISLHGTTDKIREELMPITKANPLKDLVACLEKVYEEFKRPITLEYILIKGLNDSLADAKQLANITFRIHGKVNLIPYNRIEGESYERPPLERIKDFQQYLTDAGVTTTLRYSAGSDIGAACGQLRLRKMKS